MQPRVIEKPHMIVKRDSFLEKAYELFSTRSIDAVSMQDVADASGYGVATLYRYFRTKPALVVAVAVWKWEEFCDDNRKKISGQGRELMSAKERFENFLDAFVDMYENYKDLLRFNQFFNIYIQSEEGMDPEGMKPYQSIIESVRVLFHDVYLKGMEDHTFRAGFSEEEIFSTTLHLMLAAVTRYAVGLVYKPADGFDALKELEVLKNMFMNQYTV